MSQGELHALALLFSFRAPPPPSARFASSCSTTRSRPWTPKIDGFVQVLSVIAQTHQVILFSHDDRLASVIRDTGVDARMVEVLRGADSRVTMCDNVNPALRGVNNVFALLKNENMPDDVKRSAAPGLFRIALEAAARQAYYARQSLAAVHVRSPKPSGLARKRR